MSTTVFFEDSNRVKFVRLVYTESSGEATPTATLHSRGPGSQTASRMYFAKALSANGPPDPAEKLDGTNVQDATFTTAGMCVDGADGWTIVFEAPTTGTPVGTVKVQGSCDTSQRVAQVDDSVDTWFDLGFFDDSTGAPVTSAAVTGSASTTQVVRRGGANSAGSNATPTLYTAITPSDATDVTALANYGLIVSVGGTVVARLVGAPSTTVTLNGFAGQFMPGQFTRVMAATGATVVGVSR